jgi:ABC-type branched-subunit amino acid transport system ATPase component
MHAIDVTELSSGYGRIPIISGIQLRLSYGETLGVLGHNGMGKTTLLRTLMGFIPATSGRVKLRGIDITSEPTYRRVNRGLGYVPQGRMIYPNLSTLDNLRMGCVAKHANSNTIIEQVLQRFTRLRLLLDRPGGVLSGGEQQLLALARCLCGRPSILLLDEPSEGIQPSILDQIIDVLRQVRSEGELSLVLVEQNVEFLAELADRVLIMYRGRIVGEVPGREITMDTIDRFVFDSAARS